MDSPIVNGIVAEARKRVCPVLDDEIAVINISVKVNSQGHIVSAASRVDLEDPYQGILSYEIGYEPEELMDNIKGMVLDNRVARENIATIRKGVKALKEVTNAR